MNYIESKVYLEAVSKYGSVLGLDNMIEMMERMGNPQNDLKFIHISGTNGKGSVLAYISTVLCAQGYQVGRYISPTLFSYRERIQINESEISEEDLARLVTRIRSVVEEMVAEGKPHPTIFEVETALSFLYFAEKRCDYVVLETGLGGLEDATNIVKTSIVEVITSISRDHMGFLGNTLIEIATNKAGIIKPNTMVVSQTQEPEAAKVIEDISEQNHCKLHQVRTEQITDIQYGYDLQTFSYETSGKYSRSSFYENITISLAGTYQIKNAALALEAIEAIKTTGVSISKEAVYEGMKSTKWDGRFTLLKQKPVVIIDGAHNEAAARELVKSIETYFPGRHLTYLMGVFADKEYEKIIQLTAKYAERVVAVETPNNPRALPAEELAEVWKKYHSNVTYEKDLQSGLKNVLELAGEEDVIIAFGSLSFLGAVKKYVEES